MTSPADNPRQPGKDLRCTAIRGIWRSVQAAAKAAGDVQTSSYLTIAPIPRQAQPNRGALWLDIVVHTRNRQTAALKDGFIHDPTTGPFREWP